VPINDSINFFILNNTIMPGNNQSIGGRGQEQGGPNMGNDFSRDITRESQADDIETPIVKHQDQQDELEEDDVADEEIDEVDEDDEEADEEDVVADDDEEAGSDEDQRRPV
jgi:hypothetical protein